LLEALEGLDSSFTLGTEKVEKCLQSMDQGEKERVEQRKQIIRREHSRILLSLNCRDGEVVRLLKSATMEALLKTREKASTLRTSIQAGHRKGSFDKAQLLKTQEEFEKVIEEVEYLRRNTELMVGIDQKLLNNLLEQAIYERTRDCDPKDYRLVVDQQFETKLIILAEKPNSLTNELIMNTLVVSVKAVNKPCADGTSAIPLVKDCLRNLIRDKKAVLVGNQCLLDLPASPTGFAEIDVTILGVNIKDGWKRQVSLKMPNPGDFSRFLDDTRAGNHDGLFNDSNVNGALDQSDLYSLDMTKRTRMQESPVVSVQATTLPRPLSVVAETTEPTADETVWSPLSDAQFSTMKETSMAKLGQLLASLSEELPDPEATREDACLEPASESGRLSVQEMQKSLSRENSRENSPTKAFVDIDNQAEDSPANRSIRFNHKTSIFQELSTPQVKIENKRYSIAEGSTKVRDGIAGISKKMPKQTRLIGPNKPSEEANGIKEPPADFWGAEPKQVPAPMNAADKLSESIWDEPDTSVEILTPDEAEQDILAQYDRPADPCWDGPDVTIHEQERMLNHSVLNGTLWDLGEDTKDFNFATCTFKPVQTRIPNKTEVPCLECPAFMAWLPKHEVMLITEPFKHRVGVYHQDTLDFMGWFPKNSSMEKTGLQTPLHILHLTDGTVVLIQAHGLYIYTLQNRRYREQKVIRGRFRGLAEGEEGEIITINISEGSHYIRIYSLEPTGNYEEGDSILLTLTENLKSGIKAEPRNVAYRDGKVYVTDMKIARIYVIDLKSGGQHSYGYYGSGAGHFKQPLGIILDDVGNILVADNQTSKLLLFDPRGQYIKDIDAGTELNRPMGFIRQGNCVLLSYMGENGELQGIVRYMVEPKSSGSPERKDSPIQDFWES